MPFKSKAQLRKIAELVKQGKMTEGQFQEWSKATPDTSKLPERLGPPKPKNAPNAMTSSKVRNVRKK
jgi:hypothetical protein